MPRRHEALPSLRSFLWPVTLVAMSLGCGATIDPPESTGLGSNGDTDTATTPTPGPGKTPTPANPRDPIPLGEAFVLPTEEYRLLPFSVRLRKVAAVVGLDADDVAFDAIRAARVDLGDHDFAHGISADRSWSAARVSLWVSMMRSICALDAMRARYPKLPLDLDALLQAAYGRRAEASDREDVNAALAGLDLDEQAQYEAVCLAILTSTEFVVQ